MWREPDEFSQGHIPSVETMPLPVLIDNLEKVSSPTDVVFVCRSGRRSAAGSQSLDAKGV